MDEPPNRKYCLQVQTQTRQAYIAGGVEGSHTERVDGLMGLSRMGFSSTEGYGADGRSAGLLLVITGAEFGKHRN